jgi:hypothetical protein
VIGRVVDRVDTDGVDAELLELLNVALAAGDVGNGVLRIRRAACSLSVWMVISVWDERTWLVIDTADVEALVASEESCNC